jgi:hypothetical protein
MTLTPAQQMQICTDVTNYTAHNISQANACKFAGVESAAFALAFSPDMTDADLQSACSQAVTQCNSTPPDTSGSTCDFTGVATCSADATIADFNACTTAEVSAENTAFGAVPACSALTKAWLTSNGDSIGAIVEPASCTSLAAKCPDVPM